MVKSTTNTSNTNNDNTNINSSSSSSSGSSYSIKTKTNTNTQDFNESVNRALDQTKDNINRSIEESQSQIPIQLYCKQLSGASTPNYKRDLRELSNLKRQLSIQSNQHGSLFHRITIQL